MDSRYKSTTVVCFPDKSNQERNFSGFSWENHTRTAWALREIRCPCGPSSYERTEQIITVTISTMKIQIIIPINQVNSDIKGSRKNPKRMKHLDLLCNNLYTFISQYLFRNLKNCWIKLLWKYIFWKTADLKNKSSRWWLILRNSILYGIK